MFKRYYLLPIVLYPLLLWGLAGDLIAQETAPAPASEQILSYDSDITVNADSTLLVRETIIVVALGGQIQQGIYRDIPTRYHDRFGHPYAIHFEIISVQRDGHAEGFHLRRVSDGLRIFMGKKSENVQRGEHTYELTYTVDREIGYFADYDELYWNITGNGWTLPIQQASATVRLPKGIVREAILLDAYTGRPDSAGTDYTASADTQSNASFRTTGVLGPHESLTIVVRWPKGFIRPPTEEQERQYFLEDYQADLIGLLGLIGILMYYIAMWFVAGRDPTHGEIALRADPPKGFSPAALRCLWRRAFDQKTMVVNLVDLAVKRQLAILEDASGGYILGRFKPGPQQPGGQPGSSEAPTPEIASDEKLVLTRLFAAGDTIPLVPANHAVIGGAIEALHHHLRASMEKVYFQTNSRYLIPGLLISLGIVARCGYAIQGAEEPTLLWLTLGLLPWSLGCLAMIRLAFASWRYALSDPLHSPTVRRQAMVTGAVCVPLLLAEAAALSGIVWAASAGMAVLVIILATLAYVFHLLLNTPTRSGRALFDQIEGFRMFMTAPERERRDARPPLRTTAALFEKFLPYAMALNVEKGWSEKFAAVLAQAAKKGTVDYSPAWYSGPAWDPATASTFANALGNSFSSAISSSTRAPGSKTRGSKTPRGGAGSRDEYVKS